MQITKQLHVGLSHWNFLIAIVSALEIRISCLKGGKVVHGFLVPTSPPSNVH